jgi:hypothetical protein
MQQFLRFATTYSFNTTSTTGTKHLSGAVLLVLLLVAVVLAIFYIAATWKVFEKAGRKGWLAIIPIYDTWVMFEIAGKPGWWALIVFAVSWIPFVGAVVIFILYIIAMLELAKRFGKSPAFAIFGLVIFSIVGIPILGFGDAKYSVTGHSDMGTPTAPTAPTVTPTVS